MNRHLLSVTICFALGIILNGLLEVDLGGLLFLTLVILLLALAGFVFSWKETGGVLLLLFILLGATWSGLAYAGREKGVEQFAGHYVELEGDVVREPRYDGEDTIYVMAARAVFLGDRRVETGGLVQVKVRGSGPVYGYGDLLRAGGILYIPREPGNFGAFNYRDYLKRQGICCLMTVKNPERVKLLGGEGGSFITRVALRCKGELMRVAGATMEKHQAAVLGGMLFGTRDQIDRATEEIFSETGVAHVLSVSGLHVGFVLAGTMWVAQALGVSMRAMPLVVFPVLVFYALMTGFGPAVTRAGVMALVVLVAHSLGRERDWPTALALAAFIILLYKPYSLYEIGFQLSFAATWGILYLGPPLGELFTERWKVPKWLGLPLAITIAAQLGTIPLLAYHFNLLTPVAPLANLLLVPLVGVIMLAGFLGCVAGIFFLPAGEIINLGSGMLINFFLWLAGLLEQIPGGAAYVATPLWLLMPLWFAGLVLVTEMLKGCFALPLVKHPSRVVAALIVVFLFLLLVWPPAGTGGRLQIHFLDVGQGDCILVRFPGGKNMLVDAGGWTGDEEEKRLPGDLVVVPYLHHLGINKLDALVISHPHDDHAGGVPAVVEKIKVQAVVVAGEKGYGGLINHFENKRIPVFVAGAGQVLRLDKEVDVLVLWPDKSSLSKYGEGENDTSLVLRLEYQDFSCLLTGDIEQQAQRELLAGGAELEADVLKVPHHGSRFFEPRFFASVKPVLAVIQVGDNNRFGHPAGETVEFLVEQGTRVLRTDRDGAVVISTDGKKIELRTAR